jgi:preprotein translocase subunit SecG
MEQILLVVQVIIAAALIGMVLLQRSETDGFGLGSGGGSNLMSGRATANLMTRTTAILAALFIINSLVLSIIASHNHAPSIMETIDKVEATAPAAADKKDIGADGKKKIGAPTVPNADETKPVTKSAKKVKAAVDAAAELDTSKSE